MLLLLTDIKNGHAPKCSINYEGSSGSMECQAGVDIFIQSISTRNLRYSVFVGDVIVHVTVRFMMHVQMCMVSRIVLSKKSASETSKKGWDLA